MYKYDPITHLTIHAADRNAFRDAPQDLSLPPSFSGTKPLLPEPVWEGHPTELACYWKTWELAFAHTHPATEVNGYARAFMDTHFNGHLFLWDSVFALEFLRYGRRAFNFQGTLDTFYRKQHKDGFICRELTEDTGEDCFHRFDPCSTGPNIFAWSELNHYEAVGDLERLKAVYPVLLAYHQWLRLYRSWPDGSYWYTGWGGGLDNQRRHEIPWLDNRGAQEELERRWFLNGHISWIDATSNQLMSARHLLRIGDITGETEGRSYLENEVERLKRYIDKKMWDPVSAFFYDRKADGSLSSLKSIVAYWTLLAEAVAPEKIEPFVAHLKDPAEFATPHRLPSIVRSDPDYSDDGDYWNGGVWPPTNTMVIKGLEAVGYETLAREIALNHYQNVITCFAKTGTVWENYSPSGPWQSSQSKPDNVGWSGLAPVAYLFEYVLGLRWDGKARRIRWNLGLTEKHGVLGFPVGKDGMVDLICEKRKSLEERPVIHASSTVPVDLELIWSGGRELRSLGNPSGGKIT